MYLRARHYDPAAGRFLQQDPLGLGGVDVNLYAYVGNRPTALTDPSGLFPWAECAAGGLIGAGLSMFATRSFWGALGAVPGCAAGAYLATNKSAPPATPTPTPTPAATLSGNWVVRGGESQPEALINGYGPSPDVPGVYGVSVQYLPGKSVDELAAAGQFRHGKITFATDTELIAVAKGMGYELSFVDTPGPGYHHDMQVRVSATGEVVRQLPRDLAEALSAVFRKNERPNPHRVR